MADLESSLTAMDWLHLLTVGGSMPTVASNGINVPSDTLVTVSNEAYNLQSMLSSQKQAAIFSANLANRNRIAKPPYSYSNLISFAINSSSKKKMCLAEIYQWICENFPYYKQAGNGWKNSIRHNLSLSKCFVKVARSKEDPGKGSYWAIHDRPSSSSSRDYLSVRRRFRQPTYTYSQYSPGAGGSDVVSSTQGVMSAGSTSPSSSSSRPHAISPTTVCPADTTQHLLGTGSPNADEMETSISAMCQPTGENSIDDDVPVDCCPPVSEEPAFGVGILRGRHFVPLGSQCPSSGQHVTTELCHTLHSLKGSIPLAGGTSHDWQNIDMSHFQGLLQSVNHGEACGVADLNREQLVDLASSLSNLLGQSADHFPPHDPHSQSEMSDSRDQSPNVALDADDIHANNDVTKDLSSRTDENLQTSFLHADDIDDEFNWDNLLDDS